MIHVMVEHSAKNEKTVMTAVYSGERFDPKDTDHEFVFRHTEKYSGGVNTNCRWKADTNHKTIITTRPAQSNTNQAVHST